MNEEKKKSFKTLNKVIIAIGLITVIALMTNVYAATSGYGNIFFMIKNIFTDKEVVGQDNLLSDREITISYSSIELAEGLKVQIQKIVLEENQSKLYIYVQDENTGKTPLIYKVYDENNEQIATYKSSGPNQYEGQFYTDEIQIPQKIEETAKLKLEIYNSNETLLSTMTIDLPNKEILVNGEEIIDKQSEVELKKYLGAFAILSDDMLRNDGDGYVSCQLDSVVATAMSLNDAVINKSNNADRKVIDNIIKAYYWEDLDDIINYIKNGEMSVEYYEDTDTYGVPGSPVNTMCLDINEISYKNKIYAIKFTYCLIPQDDTNIEDTEQYQATAQLKINENPEYSKYKLLSITKGTLVKDAKIDIEEEQQTENTKIIGNVNKVDYTWDNSHRFIIVYGYDEENNIVWQYETPKTNDYAQYDTIEFLGVYNRQMIYLNEEGTIKAIDYKTGRILWTNSEYGCVYSYYDYNYPTDGLYLYSVDGRKLFGVDKEGKTIKNIEFNKELDLPNPYTGVSRLEALYSIETKNTSEVRMYYKLEDDDEKNKELIIQEKELTINLLNDKVEIKTLKETIEKYGNTKYINESKEIFNKLKEDIIARKNYIKYNDKIPNVDYYHYSKLAINIDYNLTNRTNGLDVLEDMVYYLEDKIIEMNENVSFPVMGNPEVKEAENGYHFLIRYYDDINNRNVWIEIDWSSLNTNKIYIRRSIFETGKSSEEYYRVVCILNQSAEKIMQDMFEKYVNGNDRY